MWHGIFHWCRRRPVLAGGVAALTAATFFSRQRNWALADSIPTPSTSTVASASNSLSIKSTTTAAASSVGLSTEKDNDDKEEFDDDEFDDEDDVEDEETINRDKLRVFTGSAHPELAQQIADHIGIELGKAKVGQFIDGEVNIQILENVRGKDVYIVQPTGPPVNDNIIELLMMVASFRRASARRITAVIPYYGYGRQDRKREARETIAAADIARMLEAVGIDRVVCVDLHSGQTQGFFQRLTPVENLSTTHDLIVPYFIHKHLHRPVIVSPSGTGLQRVKRFRDEFHLQGIETGLAFVAPKDDRGVIIANLAHHHRVHNDSQMIMVGDVHDSDVIIIDDMIDTGARLRLAAKTAKQHGAKRIFAYATHGLLSKVEFDFDLNESHIKELVLTNTLAKPAHINSRKVHYISVASMLAEAIVRLHTGMPLSLFATDYQYGMNH